QERGRAPGRHDPQPGPDQGPRVLRLPSEAGRIPTHSGRQQNNAVVVRAPRLVRPALSAAHAQRRQSGQTCGRFHRRQTRSLRRSTLSMRYLLILAVLAFLGFLVTGMTQIRPDERVVVRRFGKVVATPGPGLWVGLPWGLDRIDRVTVDQVRRVVVGY